MSGSSAVESAHQELEALRPRLLCSRPVTDEQRIARKQKQSQALSLKEKDCTRTHIMQHHSTLTFLPSQLSNQSDSSCQRALALPYNKRWKGVWERAGAQSPPCPRLSPSLSCIRRPQTPSASPHPVVFKGPIWKNTISLNLYFHIHDLLGHFMMQHAVAQGANTIRSEATIFTVASNPKMFDFIDNGLKISPDRVSGGATHHHYHHQETLWLSPDSYSPREIERGRDRGMKGKKR